jgi:hypothetical protein
MSLSLQEHIRRSREAVAANRAKGNRHAEILTQLYSDPCRFLEEIVQNTEDAYARKASTEKNNVLQFSLYPDRIDIYHNGKEFDEEDLKSITTFAGTTKTGILGINQIGKFGIGFRSVYSVTDHPEIHCGNWHFWIDDYEILEETEARAIPKGFNTLISLPFKEKKKKEVFKTLEKGLQKINEYSLLFLQEIQIIEICRNGKLIQCISKNEVKLGKHLFRKTITLSGINAHNVSYIALQDESTRGCNKLSICFRLESNDATNLRIVKDPCPYLFVYFPTRQESHLGFLLHVQFTTTPTREQIPFDPQKTPENFDLIKKATALLLSGINELKQKGYLTPSFFEVLPLDTTSANAKDPVYGAFSNKVINVLKNKKVIPVQGGKFEKSSEIAFSTNPGITNLLDKKALVTLYQKSAWLHSDFSDFPETRQKLILSCAIKDIDEKSLAFRISANPGFLKTKTKKWFEGFYAFLAQFPELWDELHMREYFSLRNKPFILLKNGEIIAPYDNQNIPQIYFPSGKRNHSNTVDKNILKNEKTRNFFNLLGIQEYNHNSAFRSDLQIIKNQDNSVSHKEPKPDKEFEWICDTEPEIAINNVIVIDSEKRSSTSLKVFNKKENQFPLNMVPFSLQETAMQSMMKWALEFSRILLIRKYPSAKIDVISEYFKISENGKIFEVFISCKPKFQHRYIISAKSWTEMLTPENEQNILILLSDAGTGKPTVNLINDPAEYIKEDRFIIDPLYFNLLD